MKRNEADGKISSHVSKRNDASTNAYNSSIKNSSGLSTGLNATKSKFTRIKVSEQVTAALRSPMNSTIR